MGSGYARASGQPPADGVRARGLCACRRTAVAPLEHASLVREMRAFRRIAYG